MSNETDGWHVYNQRKDIVEENPIDISFLLNHLFLVVQWLSPNSLEQQISEQNVEDM